MADLWNSGRPMPGLNLVRPVLERLRSVTPVAPAIAKDSALPETLNLAVRKGPKPGWNLSNRMVFWHYGVAASVTATLFEFGVFQSLGSLANHSVAVSTFLDSLVQLLSSFQH